MAPRSRRSTRPRVAPPSTPSSATSRASRWPKSSPTSVRLHAASPSSFWPGPLTFVLPARRRRVPSPTWPLRASRRSAFACHNTLQLWKLFAAWVARSQRLRPIHQRLPAPRQRRMWRPVSALASTSSSMAARVLRVLNRPSSRSVKQAPCCRVRAPSRAPTSSCSQALLAFSDASRWGRRAGHDEASLRAPRASNSTPSTCSPARRGLPRLRRSASGCLTFSQLLDLAVASPRAASNPLRDAAHA